MAIRQARRSSERNVGGSRSKVATGQAKGVARQVQIKRITHFFEDAIADFQERARGLCIRFFGGDREPPPVADKGNPQLRRDSPTKSQGAAKPKGANPLADKGRMGKAEKGAAKGKPPTRPSRRIHPSDGVAGKQRAQPGMVASGPKKARSVDSRRSGKGRATDRGAAK